VSVLDIEELSVIYGDRCGECAEHTGPTHGGNRCPICESVVACADVSFDVAEGEVLGIVGESGSGKSSVAEAIALDGDATEGLIHYGETGAENGNLRDADYRTRRELQNTEVGLVHQHVRDGLDLSITGGGNVAGTLLSAGWRHFGEVRDRVRELFAETELPLDRMDDLASTYSGGMQRRVQIGRALANDPRLVVLDEPTAGLDVSVQARVLDVFRRIQREQGVATVVVSHDLGVVRLLADRTLVMRHGRVIERGLTDRVMEDPQEKYTQVLINSVI